MSVVAYIVAGVCFVIAALAAFVGEEGYRYLVAAGLAAFAFGHVPTR